MTKHAKVTHEDRTEIKRITAPPKDSIESFLQSVRDAELYLRGHVEERGLFEFVSMVLGGKVPDCTAVESLISGSMFSDLDQQSFGMPITGSTSSGDCGADYDVD